MRRLAQIVCMLLVALLMMYALSVGPAMFIFLARHPQDPPPPALQTFYRPLTRLFFLTRFTSRAYSWYVQLWVQEAYNHAYRDRAASGAGAKADHSQP